MAVQATLHAGDAQLKIVCCVQCTCTFRVSYENSKFRFRNSCSNVVKSCSSHSFTNSQIQDKIHTSYIHVALELQQERTYVLCHGPLLLDGFLGAEMMNLLKIRKNFKSSFGVNVKVHITKKSFVRLCSFISDL